MKRIYRFGALKRLLMAAVCMLLVATPPLVKYQAFSQSDRCTLKVLCGSLKAYTAKDSYWSNVFAQRIAEGYQKQLR